MSLVKYYNPFRELDEMRKTTNKMFGNGLSYVKPAVDIIEDEDNYVFEMALPGFTKDEIIIEAAADELVIEAKKAEEESSDEEEETTEETSSVRYIRKERRDVAYRRSFSFNKPINPEEAQVKLENGILTITLAKAPEAKPRKLTIEAAQ